MDGFTKSQGIIVVAATNRADMLDSTLLRPGRFERQFIVGLHDVKARKAILQVHDRNKKLMLTLILLLLLNKLQACQEHNLELF